MASFPCICLIFGFGWAHGAFAALDARNWGPQRRKGRYGATHCYCGDLSPCNGGCWGATPRSQASRLSRVIRECVVPDVGKSMIGFSLSLCVMNSRRRSISPVLYAIFHSMNSFGPPSFVVLIPLRIPHRFSAFSKYGATNCRDAWFRGRLPIRPRLLLPKTPMKTTCSEPTRILTSGVYT